MTLETQDMKSQLLHVLEKGEANAIPGPQLRSLLNVKDLRPHRRVIEYMVVHEGIAILGDASHGYWLAATDQEIQDNADKLDRQAKSMLKRASMVRKLKPYVAPGQQRLRF